jgi:hypothetical protein
MKDFGIGGNYREPKDRPPGGIGSAATPVAFGLCCVGKLMWRLRGIKNLLWVWFLQRCKLKLAPEQVGGIE